MVAHPEVDFVSLTGSPDTGKWIAQHAADTLKRVHLELGGKAPVIVFDDYDADSAIKAIPEAALFNAGQDCTAATRILASKKVYDDVVEGLSGEARDSARRSLDAETTLGPVIARRSESGSTGFLQRKARTRRGRHRRRSA